ncbi:hypothetical protein [Streptomyces sp. BF23-19]|uniref:hypothetical protein n=1 Tax=unclassified Streptomyces TaxID=2593676 RepID=UPI0034E47C12
MPDGLAYGQVGVGDGEVHLPVRPPRCHAAADARHRFAVNQQVDGAAALVDAL